MEVTWTSVGADLWHVGTHLGAMGPAGVSGRLFVRVCFAKSIKRVRMVWDLLN